MPPPKAPIKLEAYRQLMREIQTGRVYPEEARKNMSLSKIGERNSMFGKHHSQDSIEKIRASKLGKPLTKNKGENHGLWKGDNVSYGGLHLWLKHNKSKTTICEVCGGSNNIDYANISGEYKRDINDYICLCRKCHKNYDLGRLKLV